MTNESYPKTLADLVQIINTNLDGPHDYNTAGKAMSNVALAAFNYMSGQLGVTGFQASWAELDFIKRSRGLNHGFTLFDWNNLLYPQLLYRIPTFESIWSSHKKDLYNSVQTLIADSVGKGLPVHEEVLAYWQSLITRYEEETKDDVK